MQKITCLAYNKRMCNITEGKKKKMTVKEREKEQEINIEHNSNSYLSHNYTVYLTSLLYIRLYYSTVQLRVA